MNSHKDNYETPDQISARFSNGCDWHHHNCKEILEQICKLYAYGGKLDDEFLTRYFLFLSSQNGNYYNKCLSRRIVWTRAIELICKNIKPSKNNLEKIIKYGGDDKNIINAFDNMIKRGIKFDTELLNFCIENCNNNSLFQKLLKIVKPNEKTLEFVCKKGDIDLINNVLVHKIQASTNCINNCISANCNIHIINKMIEVGGKVDVSSLKLACQNRNDNLIKKFLQFRIVPNKECFQAIFNNRLNSNNRLAYRYKYRNVIPEFEKKDIAKTADLLIEHGYKIDYDDVVFALSKKCYINDIKRFDIKFDSKFFEHCTFYNYYPYNIDAKPTLKCLQIECGRTSNLTTVKKLISKGVKPDIKCLRAACANKSNKPMVQYLVEKHGLKPDITCIKNNADNINNVTLSYILEHYKEPEPEPEPKQKSKKLIESDEEIIDSDDLEMTNKKIDKKDDNINKKDDNIDKKEEKNEEEDFESLAKELEIDLDESKKTNKKTKKNVKIIKSDKLTKPKNLPKSKRNKEKIPRKVENFFKIKTGTKLSFIDLRKYMLEYVKKNELYDKDNKTIIKPDKKLCKLLKVDENITINFTNFDDLVYQCYKN